MRTRTAFSTLVLAAATLLRAREVGARGPEKTSPPPSRQVTVAAAADLKFALDDLVAAFRARHPEIAVTVSYGSSGNFFSQLSERAPFDLFFSADSEYPRKLAEQGNALDGSLFLYAVGRIVVWVPRSSALDVEKLGIAALTQPSVRRIACQSTQFPGRKKPKRRRMSRPSGASTNSRRRAPHSGLSPT